MPSNFWVEGNGPIEGSRLKWDSNVRINVEEIWRKYVYWIYLAQDVKEESTPVNIIMNI
jgi:hypothetical protein